MQSDLLTPRPPRERVVPPSEETTLDDGSNPELRQGTKVSSATSLPIHSLSCSSLSSPNSSAVSALFSSIRQFKIGSITERLLIRTAFSSSASSRRTTDFGIDDDYSELVRAASKQKKLKQGGLPKSSSVGMARIDEEEEAEEGSEPERERVRRSA
uniref:Uncharacterized protein n=1 Tax=Brassica oleracea var. oleracea TaxID=109376 RepID=A0A0D3CUS1_BRAOL